MIKIILGLQQKVFVEDFQNLISSYFLMQMQLELGVCLWYDCLLALNLVSFI